MRALFMDLSKSDWLRTVGLGAFEKIISTALILVVGIFLIKLVTRLADRKSVV